MSWKLNGKRMASNKSLIYQQLNFIAISIEQAEQDDLGSFGLKHIKQTIVLQIALAMEIYFRQRGMQPEVFRQRLVGICMGRFVGKADVSNRADTEIQTLLSHHESWFQSLVCVCVSLSYTKAEWASFNKIQSHYPGDASKLIAVDSVTAKFDRAIVAHWTDQGLDDVVMLFELFKEYCERSLSEDIES